MSRYLKRGLILLIIPVIVDIIGYFMVPRSIIVQFNHAAYGPKIMIFLVPVVIIAGAGLLSLIAVLDRRKSGISSPLIITAKETMCLYGVLALIIVATIIEVQQIANGR